MNNTQIQTEDQSTVTRTLYLPCSWLGYIDYQCVTDPDTIWEISRTLGKYKGYGVKISDFVEITEDQPFLYDYNNSGHPVPCYEYIFKDTRESDQPSIKPDPIVTKIAPGEYQLTLANELIYSISKVTEGANKGSWAVSGINNNFRDLFNTKKSCIEFFRAKNNNCW